jgi:hypothetical protein
MNLFEYDAELGLPQIDPIVYELKPFKALVTRDKSKNKERAKSELAFIWFWCDYKSDFSTEPDESKKLFEITNVLTLPPSWKVDALVEKAIDFYKELTSTTTTVLLEQTKKTIKKLSVFLEGIDFDKTDNSGKPVYDMKKVVDTTTQIPKLLATLKEIEIKVREEQEQLEKSIRGGKLLEAWEDGDITED